jgi:regulatory protein
MSFSRRKKPLDPVKAADPEAIRFAAIAYLGGRDFASTELHLKLVSVGYAAAASEDVVAELVAEHLINDERYAESFVRIHADRGQGPLRIARDMEELGLPGGLAAAAIKAGPDWRVRAREVRIRRFGLAEPQTWPEKAKQGRFLQYRGFSSDHIRAALGPDFDPDE